MVALREKITAWLFVLNSCLRASNCSRRFSSPAGRLPAAGLLFGYSSFAAGSLAGGISALTPSPPLPTGHLLFPHPPWLLLKLSWGLLAPASANIQGARPWGRRSALLRGTPKPGMGQHSLAGTSPLHVARCTGRAAHQGQPCCMLHGGGSPTGTSPLHVAPRALRAGCSPAGMFPLPVARCAAGATQPGRRDTRSDTGREHLGWHCPLCQARGRHQAKVKADAALSRDELPPTQGSLNPACNRKRNFGHGQMLHRCGVAAGSAGIWSRHGTDVSRAAPALGNPR